MNKNSTPPTRTPPTRGNQGRNSNVNRKSPKNLKTLEHDNDKEDKDNTTTNNTEISNQLSQAREALYPTCADTYHQTADTSINQNKVHTKTTNQTEQDYMYGMHPPFPRYPIFVPPHMQHMLQNTTQIDNPVQVETSAQRNDIPPWLASVLQDINNKLDIKLNNIEAKIEKQNQVWKNIDHILETQNKRLSKVENQLTTMNSLNENLKHSILNNKVNVQDLDKSVCEFRNKVFELEEGCQANSDFFDNQVILNEESKEVLSEHKKQMIKMQEENENLRTKQETQKETILEIQCKLMENNLIFFGIDEINEELKASEFTEGLVRQFLKEEMEIDKKVVIEKAYRIGKRSRYQMKPRPIVIKLNSIKDKEYIQHKAFSKLKDTQYAVREQFPKEIQDRRKPLYAEMNTAKKSGKKVKLIRDKLFINNEQYRPETYNHTSKSRTNTDNQNPNTETNTTSQKNYRMVYNSKRSKIPATTSMFRTPISNKYDLLTTMDETPISMSQRKQTDKRNASQRSPLEIEPDPKKHKEHSDSEDRSEEEDLFLELHAMPHQEIRDKNFRQ